MPRRADGTMSGGQCLGGMVSLYDYGGSLRRFTLELQAQARAAQGEANPKGD